MASELFKQFDRIFDYCFQLFKVKNADYGPTWLLFRNQSLNDEIWRKAKRIRTLEENHDQACIPEGRDVEYIGIINYCIMFLIKLNPSTALPTDDEIIKNLSSFADIDENVLYSAYQRQVDIIKDLLIKKNTDYDDAWKNMSITSMTDQVIIRIFRIRRLLVNKGKACASEGVAAQLHDVVNYCIFALIKMEPKFAVDG
ncbi:DUF1599 domain-containing protein [Oscillospiraceae bacterium 42-9]